MIRDWQNDPTQRTSRHTHARWETAAERRARTRRENREWMPTWAWAAMGLAAAAAFLAFLPGLPV